MAEIAGGAPIVVNFSATAAEYRGYVRAVRTRQTRATGEDIGWYAYLGAVPIGLLGGFAAIGLGIPGEYGARVAMLIGIAYILGQFAIGLAYRVIANRLHRIDLQDHQPTLVTIDSSGVTSQWRKCSTFWSWEDITEISREQSLLMFWLGHSRAIPVPRRVLVPRDESQILRIAKARIPPKPNTASGLSSKP